MFLLEKEVQVRKSRQVGTVTRAVQEWPES